MSAGGMHRRFADIGILKGASIRCVGRSPMGDPAAYLVGDAVIAVRKRDSAEVLVVPEDKT